MRVIRDRIACGGFAVEANATCLSNCFHAERQLLRTLAGALPRVPDFDLKIALGTYVWEIAQTLSDFSHRLAELREHADYPGRPDADFETFLSTIDQAQSPIFQLAGVCQVLIPALRSAYDAYICACDPLLDEPTVRVLRAARARHNDRHPELLASTSRLIDCRGETESVDHWLISLRAALDRVSPLDEASLRTDETLTWPPSSLLERFERPASFRFAADHGLDPRAIYGSPDEFYFPIEEEFQRHFLHHMVDAEMVAAELMACNIHEFPLMPLAFHLDMARQVWDEVRHAHVQWEILKNMGVPLGSYPVYHAYDLAIYRRSLLDRLILFNRLGEAGAAQRHIRRSGLLREDGLELMANLFDYLHADEVPHVANGDRWARHLFKGSSIEFQSYCIRLEADFSSSFARIRSSETTENCTTYRGMSEIR